MEEKRVKGRFKDQNDWRFHLTLESQGQFNLQYYTIRHDFQYRLGTRYTLLIQLDPSAGKQVFRVVCVIECEEEPLLRYFSPAHISLIRSDNTINSDPLAQLFKLYSPTPFINTDLNKPTFLSDDPSWTIREYEMAINGKAQSWIKFTHTIFITFYRRLFYNGFRYV